LVRTSDEVLVWAAKFDEELTDVFSVQDSISEQVAGAPEVEFDRSVETK
jgi:TolB-like protein